MLAAYLGSLAACFAVLYGTTAAEEGRISARRVGGITFVRFGRYGFNFYTRKDG